MPFIILLSGLTAVGKSTTAKKLSSILNIERIHSAQIRNSYSLAPEKKDSTDIFDFRNDKRKIMDDFVYDKLEKSAEKLLQENRSVIVDAGNFFKFRRQKFYELGAKYGIDLFVIKIVCSNERLIRKRLKSRQNNYSKSIFNEAASIEIYKSSKLIMEDPIKDINSYSQVSNVIEYDTATNTIKLINTDNNSIILKMIFSALEDL